MPRHAGRIQILTTVAHWGGLGDRSHPDLPAGDYIELAVVDNGSGMLPEVQAHIFEPFYTTKPQGEGTGLGLPSVFGIARQSGGAVLVDSTWGRGTTMRVLLPALAEPLPTGDGEGPLLVVEDEPALCRLITKVLQDRGYTVLTAAHARQALTMLEARAQPGVAKPPALLITDIGLPDMEGPELAERARTQFPGLRVLFISGAAPAEATATSGCVLRKPFTSAELARAVQGQFTATPAPVAVTAAR
jgi:CheY-like chemotaxis protein